MPRSCKFNLVFDVKLNYTSLKFVNVVKYLGHTITSDLSDSTDVARATRGIDARGRLLLRKFQHCTESVKIVLFRSYMTPIYCCHLWTRYTVQQLKRLKVAYNNVFRMLFGVGRNNESVRFIISRRLPTVAEIIRKCTFSLFSRLYSF